MRPRVITVFLAGAAGVTLLVSLFHLGDLGSLYCSGIKSAELIRRQSMLTKKQQAMVDVFRKHVEAEVAEDLETTIATMTDVPHLHNVPTMIGGYGKEGVRAFYRDHLIGQFFPPDLNMERVSLTVGEEQLVEELVISFTHTQKLDHFLPGVEPTGKKIEVAVVVIAGVIDGKISHEHIYWDQASVLVQIGLLDPKLLPVVGAESARRVLNPKLPPRMLDQ